MPDSNAADPLSSEFHAMTGDATQVGAQDLSQSLDIPIVLSLIDDAELLAQFCVESRALLEDVESAVLTLERDPATPLRSRCCSDRSILSRGGWFPEIGSYPLPHS